MSVAGEANIVSMMSSNPPAVSGRSDLYAWLVPTVRIMLGLVLVINGLNWWVKLIDPYPSLSDFAHKAPAMTFVGAMIRSGILFHLVKATELLGGIALLANRFVPLALVATLPVTLNVFIVDVFLSHHLRSHINGSGALLMSAFLMFAFLRYYWPMLTPRATLLAVREAPAAPGRLPTAFDPAASRSARRIMTVFGVAAASMGLVMLVWLSFLIEQHFAGSDHEKPPSAEVSTTSTSTGSTESRP